MRGEFYGRIGKLIGRYFRFYTRDHHDLHRGVYKPLFVQCAHSKEWFSGKVPRRRNAFAKWISIQSLFAPGKAPRVYIPIHTLCAAKGFCANATATKTISPWQYRDRRSRVINFVFFSLSLSLCFFDAVLTFRETIYGGDNASGF